LIKSAGFKVAKLGIGHCRKITENESFFEGKKLSSYNRGCKRKENNEIKLRKNN
jgi:hypothetical protein